VPQALETVYDMVAVPADKPVTIPVLPIVATDVLPLDQLPPVTVSESNLVVPAQSESAPIIVPAGGGGPDSVIFTPAVDWSYVLLFVVR
jgi:hypothetical protein